MHVKITTNYHGRLPYGAICEVVEVRQHTIGGPDYLARRADGRDFWVNSVHCSIWRSPAPTHDPDALEAWLAT